jgi:hypothetical protein
MTEGMISLRQAAELLKVPYMQVLTDPRLKKTRVNKYYNKDGRIKEQKVETPGRFPMIKLSDLDVYRLELLAEK